LQTELNFQNETAEIIVKQKADYFLCVKDNHTNLKKDIKDFVHNTVLQNTMQTESKTEKNHGIIEKRTAFVINDAE
jgi:hypothetical protein